MATDWAVEKAVMVKNEEFIQKAEALIPKLYHKEEVPVEIISYKAEQKIANEKANAGFGKDDKIIFDFGHNHAGYFQFHIKCVGSPQDAPVFLHIKFCEIEREIDEDCQNYSGWISKGWIQEEWIHIDETPRHVKLERRYAFRYAVITVIDTSQKFEISFNEVKRVSVSSAYGTVSPIQTMDEQLKEIDEVSVRTLKNCMQTVFEDGPKRDRRLWLGDVRLQALVNYQTFRQQDLVKRCLYLFAGMPNQEGMIPACVFEKPVPLMDDTFLLDYALFFLPVLVEYYENTGDRETVEELAPSAFHQIELALAYTDEQGIICEEGVNCGNGIYHCFIDWNEQLEKQCAMEAVLIYTVGYAQKLCKILGDYVGRKAYKSLEEKLKQAARQIFWEDEKQVFVSGKERQVSLASQVWMILAGVVEQEEALKLLERTKNTLITMITPYMHHFYAEAWIRAGNPEKALNHIKQYWGGMIKAGADTFWELYNPDNENESPYGGVCVNSYCHAWSCTPAYLFREYFEAEK
ncbi:MAG: hypothetical protein PHQ72_02670 [Hespellia sp.]|nr:hypothetical protein [Hespellia sp.]